MQRSNLKSAAGERSSLEALVVRGRRRPCWPQTKREFDWTKEKSRAVNLARGAKNGRIMNGRIIFRNRGAAAFAGKHPVPHDFAANDSAASRPAANNTSDVIVARRAGTSR
jgi:hypothetical protein